MEEIKNEMNEMIPEKKKGNSNVALWIVCCLSLICSLVLMCVVFCDGNEEKEDVKHSECVQVPVCWSSTENVAASLDKTYYMGCKSATDNKQSITPHLSFLFSFRESFRSFHSLSLPYQYDFYLKHCKNTTN